MILRPMVHHLVFRGSIFALFATRPLTAQVASKFIIILIQALLLSVALGQNVAGSLMLIQTCVGTTGIILQMQTKSPKTTVHVDVDDVPVQVRQIRLRVCL